ncbi:MAG: hypothetical protein EZS28_033175, partial [Streblomastix strix]
TTANVAYRTMGLIRLYCPTTNNYITSIEPKQLGAQNGLAVRYLFGKQVDINPNGTFTSSDVQPINQDQYVPYQHYVQLNAGAQDLYDGLSENGANQSIGGNGFSNFIYNGTCCPQKLV